MQCGGPMAVAQAVHAAAAAGLPTHMDAHARRTSSLSVCAITRPRGVMYLHACMHVCARAGAC